MMPLTDSHLLHFADFEPEAPLTVSEWADLHRMLPNSAAESGQWHTDRTPYLKEPMDAFCDPMIEQLIVRSSTQVGKTELLLNCLGFVIDHEPAPCMVVLPRDEDTRSWAAKRVKPMVQATPSLLAHATGKEDDLAGKLYQFDRMMVKFAGANSPADLASDPCRYVFFDEIDKYPKFSGKEADPIKLGEERTRTYWNRKIIKVSTPTTEQGYITREFKKSDQRYFWMPCPRCGQYQRLVFSRDEGTGLVRFPEDATADEIKLHGLAWYECGRCRGRIEERERVQMLDAGVWCPKGCTVNDKGKVVGDVPMTPIRGYHLSALYSPWVTWSQVSSEFLEAKEDAQLMNFFNSVLGEPFKPKAQEVKEVHVKNRMGTYLWGIIPKQAAVLTGGIDVQQDHFWFVVRAWGVGEESWLIRYGHCETWDQLLKEVVKIDYMTEVLREEPMLRLFCIDSGFRANEVYANARLHQEILRPTKGYGQQATPIRRTLLDKYPNGRVIPGGINLWTLNTDYYKDKLNRLIHTQPGDPGEWHLPSDRMEQDYFAQMTSEQKIQERNKKTGKVTEIWQRISEGRANHLWDCEVLSLAAAEMLQVYALKANESEPSVYVPAPRVGWITREPEPGQRGVPTGRSGGWMKR